MEVTMKGLLVRAAFVIVCLCGLASAANVHYQFSPSGNYPGASITYPIANNLNQVVGYYVTSSLVLAYIQDLWKPKGEEFRNIQPPGSLVSFLSGINSKGVAVGGYCTPPNYCNFPNAERGFTVIHKTYTIIAYPGAESTVAYGINDSGEVVGGYCSLQICPLGDEADHGFLDMNGVFTQLDYPGAMYTSANAINNAGIIVGIYEANSGGPHSFLYQNGVYTNIDVPGSVATNVSAINKHGVAAGYYELSNTSIHGFLRYKDGTFVTVDHPNTGATSLTGVNDAGVVVGFWSPPMGQRLTFKGVPVVPSP
jgi:probable HAF family extracellular repeat protein